jgi:hypothetical protein
MLSQKSVQKGLAVLSIVIILSLPISQTAVEAKKPSALPEGTPVIWQDPGEIPSLDLYYGEGGKEGLPTGKFKFVEQFNSGTTPKLLLEDEHGDRWLAKLGEEAQAETVATRLLWAAGYYTDETYYFPSLRVEGYKVSRNHPMPGGGVIDGMIQGARLEHFYKDRKFISWSWFDNPFLGTKELDGLRVMMALINNWDLKEKNNTMYLDEETHELRYYVHDIGAAFGKTGGVATRSKNNLEDYVKSEFIKRVTPESVDLVLDSRPSWILAIHVSYFQERAQMSKICEQISRSHARWIGERLSELSDKQIYDAFRSAGYGPDETRMFATALMARINELTKL